jgi:hypothetical protein
MALYNSSRNSQTANLPTNATVVQATLGTAPSPIVVDRSATRNRRGFAVENTGQNPIVFAYGSSVSLSNRTIELFPGDYFEDIYAYQGPIVAMSSGVGTANITEIVII